MNRYITTTLPYVNGEPHIGHAVEFVQADVLARTWRAQGDEVFFTTGTDEHGQKIYEAALKAGKTVQEYVNHYSEEMKKLKELLSLSTDAFIRTTDPKHYAAAQEMWRRCEAAGDIYKKSYTGLYCVGCEAYKTEKDLTDDGHCLIHPNLKPEEVTEENYFFRLSNYQQKLEEYLSNASCIFPEWRRLEALNFVQAGLEDFSISRDKARLTWGIPIPGDDTQVMYVWFDALTNYISVLGWPDDAEGLFKKFWDEGETLQTAGKDQVRFQSIMWQAMLMSANLPTTDKMSKSLGNVIGPYELVEKYGVEATRYFLLRHVHPTDDSDVTWEKLDEWYTAHLVNGLGNLVARVMKLAETHLDEPHFIGFNLKQASKIRVEKIVYDFLDLEILSLNFGFDEIVNSIWSLIQRADERITKDEPFKVIKTDKAAGEQMIKELVEEVEKIGVLLQTLMPATSELILASVKENKKPENLFPRLP